MRFMCSRHKNNSMIKGIVAEGKQNLNDKKNNVFTDGVLLRRRLHGILYVTHMLK